MHRTRTMTLLTIGALSVAALTGCSGEQSVADACSSSNTVVEDTLDEASTTLQTELADANYSAAADAVGTMEEALTDAAGSITNAEVREPLDDMIAALGDFGTALGGMEDGDTEGLGENAEELQAAALALQESGLALATVCGG